MIRNNIKNYIEKEDDINEKLTNKENMTIVYILINYIILFQLMDI